MHFVDVLAIVIVGLMIGNELTVSLFINPVMRRLDAAAQTLAISLFAGILGRVMPFWYALCFVLLLVETLALRGHPEFSSLLVATLLWAGVIVFTLATLVPINNRIAALAANAPLGQWLPSHTRWERLHRVRIALLLTALVLLVHGLMAA